MRNCLKTGIVALALALATPAVAGVHVGIGVGFPGTVYVGDPCVNLDPAVAAPYYCTYPVYNSPVWVGGVRYTTPLHFRVNGGQREFWTHGQWRGEDRGVSRGRR